MSQTAPFEIEADGILFKVEPGASGLNVYRLYSKTGHYLVAKDLYNIWVELNRKPGSANISLSAIGRKIDEHRQNRNCACIK